MAKLQYDIKNLDVYKNIVELIFEILTDKTIDKDIRQTYYNKLADIIELDEYYPVEELKNI